MAKPNVSTVIKAVSDVLFSDKGREFICGTYGNGETRSFIDAMQDNYVDPKTREKMAKKHKKKKKKKKKGKAQNSDIFITRF